MIIESKKGQEINGVREFARFSYVAYFTEHYCLLMWPNWSGISSGF